MHITKSSNLKTPDFESSATNSIFKENKTIVQAKKNLSASCFILTSCLGLPVHPNGTAMGHKALWDTAWRPLGNSSL